MSRNFAELAADAASLGRQVVDGNTTDNAAIQVLCAYAQEIASRAERLETEVVNLRTEVARLRA